MPPYDPKWTLWGTKRDTRVVKGMCKKTHTWQVAENHGNGYRAKALELLDKADGETDSRMRAEFENLPEKKSIQNLSLRRLPASIYKCLTVPKRSSLWRNNTPH